ncbi:ABC transporter permease, partial [Actinotalea ferrariae]|uniref:ABC transporter permease n=1 Tax=Actinotalea ferrariae TaxID=1386098 RepID=UPI001C8CE933
MLRLTLAQMRRSLGRLASAGIAIAIGTAFVAATLLASDVMTRTTYDVMSSGFAEADLVVTGEVTERTVSTLQAVPGVRAVHGYSQQSLALSGPDGQTVATLAVVAEDPELQPGQVAEGSLPGDTGEVALPRSTAEVLGAEVGDRVDATLEVWRFDEGSETSAPERRVDELTLVGLLDVPEAAFLSTGGVGAITAEQSAEWDAFWDEELETWYWHAVVLVEPGASVADVQGAAAQALPDLDVRTRDQAAQAMTAEVTGDANQFTAIVLGFAGVSMLVAALVIANTFQVLVAQRTRTLALLRCVGADRSQLRRSVVLEALILGVVASLVGVVSGIALVQTGLLVLGRTWTSVPLPTTVTITAAVVLAPVAVGTLMTVLAALSPAIAATRVAPLAALRPAGSPTLGERSGRVRAWASGLLVVGGGLVLALGMVLAARYDLMLGLLTGVVGGAASFVGVVLSAVFWVPRLVGGVGTVLTRAGRPAARLAAANSVRNPRRTAATSAALLIGVTLVAMMSTGAASARSALDSALAEEFPVDVAVGALGDGFTAPALPPGFAAEVRAVDGVTDVTELIGTTVEVVEGVQPGVGAVEWVDARGVDPDAAATVVRDPSQVAGLDDQHVLVPAGLSAWTELRTGDQITVRRQPLLTPGETAGPTSGVPTEAPSENASERAAGTASEAPGEPVTVTVVVTDLPGQSMIFTPGVLDRLDEDAQVSRLWVRLDTVEGAARAVGEITAAASATGEPLETVGAAVERALYQQVVDTLLAVVVGLLAVAVVIALVGVTNTLSLSVLERRR